MTRLDDESVERDIEVAAVKLKYEIRRQEEIELLEGVEYDNLTDKKIKLDESIENETETELKEARERQVFDPINKIFDFSKRRATDCVENSKVNLSHMVGTKEESQLELLRSLLWDEYLDFKKDLITKKEKMGKKNAKDVNQEYDNLTK